MSNNKRTLTLGSVVVLAVLFIALIMLSNTLLRGMRIDLTDSNLYTLSEGSENIVESIDEPINLYLFFSDKMAADIPSLRSYAQRVEELLQEMALASGGALKVETVDPEPFSEQEDMATQFGITPIPTNVPGENLYLGLAGTNSVGDTEVLPFLQPDKEVFLEYDVARLIHNLVNPEKPVIGVMSSLPMTRGFDPQTNNMREPWMLITQIEKLFEVRSVPTTATSIEDDIDVLMVVHPKAFSDDTLYAIDQFVLGGGRALVFVDPHAEMDQPPQDPSNPSAAMFADRSSDLGPLLEAWGVDYQRNQVLLDLSQAMQLSAQRGQPPVRHLAVLSLQGDSIDSDDVITGGLNSVTVSHSGTLAASEGAGTTMQPLLMSSTESMLTGVDRVRFLPNPSALFQGFEASGEHKVIGARISGLTQSAFPDRAASEGDEESSGDDESGGHISESDSINVLVFADTDLLSDRLWVQVQNIFGQRLASAWADNGDLVFNGLDNLTGSGDLISIRGRATSARPFTKVQALERDAEQRFRATEEALQTELRDLEQKLNELQSGRAESDNPLILSEEQQQELERFQQEQLRVRKELRGVRHELDRDIESLGSWLKAINIGLIPLIVAVIAVVLGAMRVRRRTS